MFVRAVVAIEVLAPEARDGVGLVMRTRGKKAALLESAGFNVRLHVS
jgi:hypothetical protein